MCSGKNCGNDPQMQESYPILEVRFGISTPETCLFFFNRLALFQVWTDNSNYWALSSGCIIIARGNRLWQIGRGGRCRRDCVSWPEVGLLTQLTNLGLIYWIHNRGYESDNSIIIEPSRFLTLIKTNYFTVYPSVFSSITRNFVLSVCLNIEIIFL